MLLLPRASHRSHKIVHRNNSIHLAMLSGIWGIYFYREVQKQAIVARWFASALVTIAGILLLGYESSPADPDSDASTALNVSIVDS